MKIRKTLILSLILFFLSAIEAAATHTWYAQNGTSITRKWMAITTQGNGQWDFAGGGQVWGTVAGFSTGSDSFNTSYPAGRKTVVLWAPAGFTWHAIGDWMANYTIGQESLQPGITVSAPFSAPLETDSDANYGYFNYTSSTTWYLSTVTITALDASAFEYSAAVGESLDTGVFRVSRTGSTSSSLTVYVDFSGTATGPSPSMDYETEDENGNTVGSSVVIPAGDSYVDIVVLAWFDYEDSPETVILDILPSAYYATHPSQSSATVTVYELPRVSVSAIDNSVIDEPGLIDPDLGVFRISRIGSSTTSSLSVYVSFSGTAIQSPSMDYSIVDDELNYIFSPFIIPAGASYVDVFVLPWWDGDGDSGETVILNLSEHSTYIPYGSYSDTVWIYE